MKTNKNAKIFQKLRRNSEQDNMRSLRSMEIPSDKLKAKKRNRKKVDDSKYYGL